MLETRQAIRAMGAFFPTKSAETFGILCRLSDRNNGAGDAAHVQCGVDRQHLIRLAILLAVPLVAVRLTGGVVVALDVHELLQFWESARC